MPLTVNERNEAIKEVAMIAGRITAAGLLLATDASPTLILQHLVSARSKIRETIEEFALDVND